MTRYAVPIPISLVVDVFVGKDGDVVAEDNQGIPQLIAAALATLETLVGEDIGLRPEPKKGLAAQGREDALRRVGPFRLR